MGRCTVKQGRTQLENPTVSSGDPLCSDSWMAAAEMKLSSLWKWCLRTLSILLQVYSVISVHMYNMCTSYVHIYIYVCHGILSMYEKLYCIFSLKLKVFIFTKLSVQNLINFFKGFYNVDISNTWFNYLIFIFFYRWCFGYGKQNRKRTGFVKDDSTSKNDRVSLLIQNKDIYIVLFILHNLKILISILLEWCSCYSL